MKQQTRSKLASFVNLLTLHRGEARDAYDRVAPAYDNFAQVWDHYIAGPAIAYYNQIIEQRVKPNALVLDAGAGTGERTLALLKHSQPGEVVAFDASTGMLNVARSKIRDDGVRFVAGDVIDLPFGAETFDVVSCTWVVEIMDDPRATVQEFVRVIKPDGFVVYVFCSLPEGRLGEIVNYVLNKAIPQDTPLSHLLSEAERPFHDCDFSSLKQFAGGLITVATVGKCCPIIDPTLPCRFEIANGSNSH